MPTIDKLEAPEVNLTVTEKDGRLTVTLNLPPSSGSARQTPFLEVTRNEQQQLLAAAQQEVLKKLAPGGFTVTDIKYEGKYDRSGGASGQVPGVGEAKFEIAPKDGLTVNIRNNPNIRGAIEAGENKLDEKRNEVYLQRSREWAEQGGATIKSGDRTWKVTPDSAADYYNSQKWFPWEKIEPRHRAEPGLDKIAPGYRSDAAPGESLAAASAAGRSSSLADADHPLARHYSQALEGIKGVNLPESQHRDAAALLVKAAADAGFDAKGDLRVVAGTRGDNLFAVQGADGPAPLRAAVARTDIQPGMFELASTALAPKAEQMISLGQTSLGQGGPDQNSPERRPPPVMS